MVKKNHLYSGTHNQSEKCDSHFTVNLYKASHRFDTRIINIILHVSLFVNLESKLYNSSGLFLKLLNSMQRTHLLMFPSKQSKI
jgi:hypothetical protein